MAYTNTITTEKRPKTYLACPPLVPLGAPKCLRASLLLWALKRTVLEPVGHLVASWSKVMQDPPAAMILLLAASEKDRAQTVILGQSSSLSSSSTLQTTTAILPESFYIFLAINDRDIGYLETLEWFNLLKTVLLKLEFVLLAKNV